MKNFRHARKQHRPLTVTVPTVTPPPPTGTGGQPTAPPTITAGVANSNMIAWSGIPEIYQDDNYLNDKANNRHYGGMGVDLGFLYGYGGTTTAFTPSPTATFNAADGRTGAEWTRQRQMKNSNYVARCNARGMEVWIGYYQANYDSGYFHAGDWFDDAAWAEYLSTSPPDGQRLFNLVAACSRMGVVGFMLDGENYPTVTGQEDLLWDWDYPGNTHTEAQTRAKAKQRGAETMTCILAAWAAGGNPNPPKFMQYTAEALHRSYRALMLSQPSGNNLGINWGSQFLYHDYWHGMCSVAGYGKITQVDAVFDKSPQISGMSWDSAMQYGTNNLAAYWSRYFDPATWAIACEKIGHNAMFWIDKGATNFEQVMPPSTALAAGQAFRKYGTNGDYTLYGHHLTETSVDPAGSGAPWSNYWSTLASITSTTSPSSTAPTLTGVTATNNILQGEASHPEGIRCVKWERRTGTDGSVVADSGALPCNWAADSITNISPGYYNNKPHSFSQLVSGGAGAWYVVTAVSTLGQRRSVVVQTPGGSVVTPPEELPEEPEDMFPDVIHRAGAEHLRTVGEVETAAAQGITLSMNYPDAPVGALATAMTANGVKYLDRTITDIIYAVIPAYSGGTPTLAQEDAMVADAVTYLNASASNPLIAGHYILDDWPGNVLNTLKRITAQARIITPDKPTVLAMQGIWDFWPPSDPTHANQPYSDHNAFNFSMINYHPDSCDIIAFYIYGIPGVIGFPTPSAVPHEDVDWTGEYLWPYIKSVLTTQGWDPSTGFMFTAHAFTSTNPWQSGGADPYPEPTAAEIATQVRYAVEAGAHSTLAYIWNQFGIGQSLTNRADWQLGYEDGNGQAKILWRGLPVGIGYEYDAREARTIHATGSNLTIWDNASGSLGDMDYVQSTPKTGTRDINGNNVIEFGSAPGELIADTSVSLTSPYTVFVLCQSDQTSQTGTVFGTNTGIELGQVGTQWMCDTTIDFGGGTVDLEPHVLTLVVNGATSLLYVDSVLIATGTCPTTTATVFGLGGNGGTSVFDGVVAHAMIWPGTLFSPDRLAIETYLRDEWLT